MEQLYVCVCICILHNNPTDAYKMLQTAYVSRAVPWAQTFQWFKNSEEVGGCGWWPMQWMTENDLQLEFVNKEFIGLHKVHNYPHYVRGKFMWIRQLFFQVEIKMTPIWHYHWHLKKCHHWRQSFQVFLKFHIKAAVSILIPARVYFDGHD